MLNNRQCSRKGCGHEARWRPVIVIPEGSLLRKELGEGLPTEGPVKIEPQVMLCDRHKEAGVEDFLSSKAWDRIRLRMHRAGKEAPDLSAVKLEFAPLEDEKIIQIPLSFQGPRPSKG